jgi:hypothetical protein
MPHAGPSTVSRSCLAACLLAVTLIAAGCAEPPRREMDQAQGAIDAARAAGAAEYAAAELEAAVAALAQADQAVAARDYRLALASALNSREQAQNAAKTAVDARARARGDAERLLAEATATVQRARTRLDTPAVARLPRRTLAPIQKVVRDATTALQEARTALEGEGYQQVIEVATRVAADVESALEALDDAAVPPRRR